MQIFCKRLPATDDTLNFLSPFMEKPHIQKYIDAFWKTYYGIYDLFLNIRFGDYRIYGAFEIDESGDAKRFLGFQLCVAGENGNVETHCFWDRKTPVLQCVKLAREEIIKDYAADDKPVKCFVGYIPESHIAAQWLALNMGFECCGKVAGWERIVDGKQVNLIEYRLKEGV